MSSGAKGPWLNHDHEVWEQRVRTSGNADLSNVLREAEQKWKEEQNRKRLNPERVGADFVRAMRLRAAVREYQKKHNLPVDDQDSGDDETYFPSFGRVFNEGPRSSSKREFYQERPSQMRTHLVENEIDDYVTQVSVAGFIDSLSIET